MATQHYLTGIATAFGFLIVSSCAPHDANVADTESSFDTGFLVFECSGEEPFWQFRAEPRSITWRRPADTGIDEKTSSGRWTQKDENAGRYVWSYDNGGEIVIIREQCMTVSSEILSYRLERRDMPEGCCRRFSE